MRRTAGAASAAELAATMEEAWQLMRNTAGHLARDEARFLALAAAGAPAAGVVLEIGSLKGRSTICLAYASAKHGRQPVVAVDPHTSPADTDAPLHGQSSSYEDFLANLQRAGVRDTVEVHRAFSHELAADWNRPIRLLWIDGDHTYTGTREDVALYLPHLASGGIIALHDVAHGYEGPDRVFAEEILRSDRFGPAGVCRSIGWAQYLPEKGAEPHFRRHRQRLASRVERLAPLVRGGRKPMGLQRLVYKLLRSRIPRGPVDPAIWLATVT